MNTPPETDTRSMPSFPQQAASGWLALLLILTVIWLAIWQTSPPPAKPTDAPASEFSAARAMVHLEQIAAEIHPSGTPAHARVRDYLVSELEKMGLDPQVQRTTALHQFDDQTFDKAATVENILVRLKGEGSSGKAVLLMAHYDSSVSSYGANRDGSAVAAFLETIRNLQAGDPLQNDVIVLFTDAEEAYLMGVKAFADEHPWAQDIGVALNFDSRGASGPVVLFETSPGNGNLIRQFATAAADSEPLANSFLYALYEKLNYASDFTVLKNQLNAPGLNFGYADETQHYHNTLDNLASVNTDSVQHLGEYALSLTRHFGNADLTQPAATDRVFFNLGGALITYSTTWVLPLTGLLALLFLAVLIYGLKRRRLSAKGFVVSALVFPLLLLAGGGLAQAASMLAGMFQDPFGQINRDELYMFAYAGLAVFAVTGLLVWLRPRLGLLNLMTGAALWWLVLAIATALLLPSGSYLFAWPLFFGMLTLGHLIHWGEARDLKHTAIIGVLAIPALLLVGQMIYMVLILLGHALPAVHGILIALLLGLLLPLVSLMMPAHRRKLVWGPSLAVGLGTLAVALILPAYSEEAPKSNSLLYGYDADEKKGYYASIDLAIDPFLQPYVGGGERTPFNKFYPKDLGYNIFTEKEAAQAAAVQPSQVTRQDTAGSPNLLSLRISPTQPLLYTLLTFESDQPLTNARINGKPITHQEPDSGRWEIYYYAPHDGFDIELETEPNQQVTLRVVDTLEGFPQALGIDRPADMAPNYYSDMTFVAKHYQY